MPWALNEMGRQISNSLQCREIYVRKIKRKVRERKNVVLGDGREWPSVKGCAAVQVYFFYSLHLFQF